MEGLEISELSFSEFLLDNEKFRIDSEFFLKKYVESYKKIKSKPHVQLKAITSLLTDYHANGSYEVLNKHVTISSTIDFAYMVRSTDFECDDFQYNVKYIDQHAYEFLNKSKIYGEELLINKIGSPGRVYLMPKLDRPVSLGMNLFMIRLKNNSNYNTKFLWAYFKCRVGKNIIQRKINGTVPLTIDKEAIKSLYIPKLTSNIQTIIESLVDRSSNRKIKSRELYNKAASIFLEALSFTDDKLEDNKFNIKSFQASFLFTGRLDAEYYQPKYDDYINIIKNYHNGYGKLIDICNLKNNNYLPKNSCEYKYIELSNIGSQGDINGCSLDYGQDLPSRARRLIREGDVLVSSIEGSLSSCALVSKEYDNAICSTGFYVINSEKINSETLLVLFKSELMQSLLKQICSGTILTAINSDEFKNLLVPIIDEDTQKHIAERIQQSFNLKKQSEQLLEVAKTAVEIAIEQNEDVAIEYINSHSQLMSEDGNLH